MTQTTFWENIEQFHDMTFIGEGGEVKSNMAILNHKCSYLGNLTEHLFMHGEDIKISVPEVSTETIKHAIEKLFKEDDDQPISEICGIVKHPLSKHEPMDGPKLEATEVKIGEFENFLQIPTTLGPEEIKMEEVDDDDDDYVENNIPKMNKRFECPECGLKFTTSHYMRSHVDAIHKGVEFSCSQCNYKTPYKHNLLKHVRLKHTELPKYCCTICGKEYTAKRRLKEHELTHGERNIQCPKCDSKFYSKLYLDKHCKSVHGEENFSCEVCGKKFTTEERMRDHFNAIHLDPKERKHLCKICDKGFHKISIFRNHMNKHLGLKPYKCPADECDKRFSDDTSYHHHKRSCSLLSKQNLK